MVASAAIASGAVIQIVQSGRRHLERVLRDANEGPSHITIPARENADANDSPVIVAFHDIPASHKQWEALMIHELPAFLSYPWILPAFKLNQGTGFENFRVPEEYKGRKIHVVALRTSSVPALVWASTQDPNTLLSMTFIEPHVPRGKGPVLKLQHPVPSRLPLVPYLITEGANSFLMRFAPTRFGIMNYWLALATEPSHQPQVYRALSREILPNAVVRRNMYVEPSKMFPEQSPLQWCVTPVVKLWERARESVLRAVIPKRRRLKLPYSLLAGERLTQAAGVEGSVTSIPVYLRPVFASTLNEASLNVKSMIATMEQSQPGMKFGRFPEPFISPPSPLRISSFRYLQPPRVTVLLRDWLGKERTGLQPEPPR